MEKKFINIFYTRGTTPTKGTHNEDSFYKWNKASSPKVKGNFLFLPLQRYMTKHHVALHATEARRVTSLGTAANILVVIKYEKKTRSSSYLITLPKEMGNS